MSFLMRLLGQDSPENSISADEERFWTNSSAVMTSSGARVNSDTALKVSAAWACTRLISETVAMLPHIVYKRLDNGGKERASDHPLYDILHDQPNNRQTSFEFTDMLQMHALLRGSGYAKIKVGPRGPVDKLIPVHPDRVIDVEEVDDDTLRYKILDRGGQINTYTDDEIFELRGLSLDGVKTVSVMTYARESFGLSIAAEHFGAKLFGNYSRPGGFLKHPGHLSEEAQIRLRNQTERMTSGENLHRLGVLEEGMEYQQVTLSPEDSQMLETREFQAEDVCRWFRVPPHMVGLTSKATSWGSGIEELSRGYVTFVLMPWLVRWQQLISKDLIIATDQYFVEFLTEALLRGDIEKRYSAYNIGRNGGWLATNDIRRPENMNPIPGGDDDYLTALNMKRSLDMNGNPDSGNAHYQQIVQESAARVVRKEVAAMTRAAERKDSDWYSAVDDFCKSHVEFVAQTMCIPFVTAIMFVESGRKELTEKGPVALAGWANRRTAELIRLSTEV
ncbi:MAG TPA: phage portal protein [Anaerolineaceae bacterium]|nr:phage portal protein [Anaerolineaceae bacterium]